MSLPGFLLDAVLIALLVIALFMGLRLDRRLKSLKAGQEAFAKAVNDLDEAAMRAFSTLKSLRQEAEDDQDLLHGRILAARELIPKLDSLSQRSENLIIRLEQLMNAGRDQGADIDRLKVEINALREGFLSVKSEMSLSAQAQQYPRDYPAFERDTVPVRPSPPTQPKPSPHHTVRQEAQRPLTSPSPAQRIVETLDEDALLDRVQMSELVVANLNSLIKQFEQKTTPLAPRPPKDPLQDLFDDPL